MTEKALQELASILNPTAEITQSENPLLIAVGAVGKSLGIKIRPATISKNHSLPEQITAIAGASGFRVRQVTLTPNWWKTDSGSLLGFTQEDNQPVALLPVKAAKYEILNAVQLKRIPLNQHTASQLSPVAYTFYRPFPDKEIKIIDIFKFSSKGRTADYLKIVLVGVMSALLGMVTPQIMGLLIDHIIPDANRKLLVQMGLGLLAASFGIVIFQITQSFILLRLQTTVSFDIQAAVWDRLLKLKPTFFRDYSTGDLHNRVSAITQIRSLLSGSILRTLLASLFSLLNLGLLLAYSPPLTLIALGVTSVTIIITTVSSVITRRKMRSLQQLSGEIFGLKVQLLNGISKLRVAAAESEAFYCWAKKIYSADEINLKYSINRRYSLSFQYYIASSKFNFAV
ncbi:MAG: ABC transporter transmembrane domain-containing protein [Cyanobacteria bacterium J06636_27]